MSKAGSTKVIGPSGCGASVSAREIENGYVVSESHYTGNEYHSKEYFSPTKPEFTISTSGEGSLPNPSHSSAPKAKAKSTPSQAPTSLRGATSHLSNRRK